MENITKSVIKKIFIIAIAAFLSIPTIGYTQKVICKDKTFKIETTTDKAQYTKTDYFWEIKGEKFPIYISKKGALFIIRKSKNNKEYKYYFPKNVQKLLKSKIKL